jgi:hypothetical protein
MNQVINYEFTLFSGEMLGHRDSPYDLSRLSEKITIKGKLVL